MPSPAKRGGFFISILIAQLNNIEKSYADRLLFKTGNLKIYQGDRIGLVGANGSGKTTLLDILAGRAEPDAGSARICGPFSYIMQLEKEGVPGQDHLSGGELTRLKIEKALGSPGVLLLADEPTANLDVEGLALLEREILTLDCAMLIVSHDRAFLDAVCNIIMELENGCVTVYHGNYSNYRLQKEALQQRNVNEYEKYASEKRRLEKAAQAAGKRAGEMRATPRRMGNSEARLHRLGNQKAEKAVAKTTDALRTRIEHLSVKQKPKGPPEVKMDLRDSGQPGAKIVLQASHLSKSYGGLVIFEDTGFYIRSGTKTAVLGPNGCGKTTFLELLHSSGGVTRAPGLRPGYFRQDLSLLDDSRTLLDNLTDAGYFDNTHARLLLARMNFTHGDIDKPAGVLSGGERVKASLCKIITGGFNLLLLDEPTNYLDIFSTEALEEALQKYDGTLVFVTHDRRFAGQVADHVISIENHSLLAFDGGPAQWLEKKAAPGGNTPPDTRRMLLENRLAFLASRLAAPSRGDDPAALEEEYRRVLAEIKNL